LEPIEDSDYTRNLRVVQSRNAAPESTVITWIWDTGCFHDIPENDSEEKCKFHEVWAKDKLL
jgi:hypothetical protein